MSARAMIYSPSLAYLLAYPVSAVVLLNRSGRVHGLAHQVLPASK